jgi:hypothetical protein
MKAFKIFILLIMIASFSIIVLPVFASNESTVGVKKGDWIEYNVTISGPLLDEARNLTSFRNEILEVNGCSFETNMTSASVNGTVLSSLWTFNLTGGEVCGWMIIPANLNAGEKFFDAAKAANVTIEGQEQKIVAGESRTVTHETDPGKLYKEWDKTTGVYVNSVEYTRNYTVITNATATNLWGAQSNEAHQTTAYLLISIITVLAIFALFSIFVFVKLRGPKKYALPRFSQGKIAATTILTVILAEICFILFFPFYSVGLSFAEINLVFQTFWTALVFVSLRYRKKGNYFLHELSMLVVMSAWLVGFSAVLTMDPLSSNPVIVSNSLVRLAMNGLHAIFSIPALVFGLWLVVLWRPESMSFATKSRRIAQLMLVFWVPSYVVGVVDFLLLHTALLG